MGRLQHDHHRQQCTTSTSFNDLFSLQFYSSTMAPYLETVKVFYCVFLSRCFCSRDVQSFADVPVTDAGVDTVAFLEAAQGVVGLFGACTLFWCAKPSLTRPRSAWLRRFRRRKERGRKGREEGRMGG